MMIQQTCSASAGSNQEYEPDAWRKIHANSEARTSTFYFFAFCFSAKLVLVLARLIYTPILIYKNQPSDY